MDDFVESADGIAFTLTGPSAMTAQIRLALPKGVFPTLVVTVGGERVNSSIEVEAIGNTALIKFDSTPAGARVEVKW